MKRETEAGAHDAQDPGEIEILKKGLIARLERHVPACGDFATAIPSLIFIRREGPTEPVSYMQEPSVCLIAQGAKRVFLGDERFEYDANHFLVTALDLPIIAEITKASRARPYLGIKLRLDQRTISQLIADASVDFQRGETSRQAMTVSELTLPLISAFLRLIDLLDEPESIPVLGPLIEREITYRLLTSEQGPLLHHIGTSGSQGYQISRAIGWLMKNFDRPFKVDDLAKICRMSTSSFHHYFRSLTSMSPLQYQKWLRLQEARRIMLAEGLDAANAAFRVGYESASQFSREYRRMFSESPARDVRALRQQPPREQVE